MPTDEELARVAWAAYIVHDDELVSPDNDPMLDVARAVREALTPPAEPLRRGEMIFIPDSRDGGKSGLSMMVAGSASGAFILDFDSEHVPGAWRKLDLDGVRQLRDACDRWLAAQDVP